MSSSDHSSLVATFKEKFRPKYGGKCVAANSRYIKENVYFNGVALKESLLHDNECAETVQQTPNRRLQRFTRDDKTVYTNAKRYFELEKGCFVYQNPTSYCCNDNDVVHKFTGMSLITEVGIDSDRSQRTFDNKTFRLTKNDREEIRKRLVEPYHSARKSSLESRLQNGSNLQLCFTNEQSSDTELHTNDGKVERIQNLELAKNRAMANMMSEERNSVISAVIKQSLSKVGVILDNNRRRISRQFLMHLNLAQLQIIVNDLHSYIEYLNESLVNLLLERDELHMAKDSVLVDIEDLNHITRISY